jgi:hypothetical protein
VRTLHAKQRLIPVTDAREIASIRRGILTGSVSEIVGEQHDHDWGHTWYAQAGSLASWRKRNPQLPENGESKP